MDEKICKFNKYNSKYLYVYVVDSEASKSNVYTNTLADVIVPTNADAITEMFMDDIFLNCEHQETLIYVVDLGGVMNTVLQEIDKDPVIKSSENITIFHLITDNIDNPIFINNSTKILKIRNFVYKAETTVEDIRVSYKLSNIVIVPYIWPTSPKRIPHVQSVFIKKNKKDINKKSLLHDFRVYYQAIPFCARNRLLQKSGTCWLNTVFNLLFLTPVIKNIILDKINALKTITTDDNSCPIDITKEAILNLFKRQFIDKHNSLSTDYDDIITPIATILNSSDTVGENGGNSDIALLYVLRILEIDATVVINNDKEVFLKFTDIPGNLPYKSFIDWFISNDLSIYDENPESPKQILVKISPIDINQDGYELNGAIIQLNYLTEPHVITGIKCFEDYFIYDSNIANTILCDWRDIKNVIEMYNVPEIKFACALYIKKVEVVKSILDVLATHPNDLLLPKILEKLNINPNSSQLKVIRDYNTDPNETKQIIIKMLFMSFISYIYFIARFVPKNIPDDVAASNLYDYYHILLSLANFIATSNQSYLMSMIRIIEDSNLFITDKSYYIFGKESEYIINHIIKITPKNTHTRADFSTFLKTYRDFEYDTDDHIFKIVSMMCLSSFLSYINITQDIEMLKLYYEVLMKYRKWIMDICRGLSQKEMNRIIRLLKTFYPLKVQEIATLEKIIDNKEQFVAQCKTLLITLQGDKKSLDIVDNIKQYRDIPSVQLKLTKIKMGIKVMFFGYGFSEEDVTQLAKDITTMANIPYHSRPDFAFELDFKDTTKNPFNPFRDPGSTLQPNLPGQIFVKDKKSNKQISTTLPLINIVVKEKVKHGHMFYDYGSFVIVQLHAHMDPMTDFDNSKKEFENSKKEFERKKESHTKKSSEYLLNTILMGAATGNDFVHFLYGQRSYTVNKIDNIKRGLYVNESLSLLCMFFGKKMVERDINEKAYKKEEYKLFFNNNYTNKEKILQNMIGHILDQYKISDYVFIKSQHEINTYVGFLKT